jgi:hypothetical protein
MIQIVDQSLAGVTMRDIVVGPVIRTYGNGIGDILREP